MRRFQSSRNQGRGRQRGNPKTFKRPFKSGKEYTFYTLGMSKNKVTEEDIKEKLEHGIQKSIGDYSMDIVSTLR